MSRPETEDSPFASLDFDSLTLNFEKPDLQRFPMLALAYEALRGGGLLPAAYNAANEKAVEAFFRNEIGFLEIPAIVGYVLKESRRRFLPGGDSPPRGETIEAVLDLDRKARELAGEFIKNGVHDADH